MASYNLFTFPLHLKTAGVEAYYTELSPGFGGLEEQAKMVYATEYFWVVICKNYRFHHKENVSYAHQIALG